MKKYARFMSFVLVCVMSLFAFACTPIEDNDIKDETPAPNHIDLDKLKPLDSGKGSIIRPAEDNKFFVYYGGYNEDLMNGGLTVIDNYDEFKQFNMIDWLSQYAASFDETKDPELATEEYFETHYLVVFRMALTSGSQKVNFKNIEYGSDTVKIYLSCDIDGDVGTSDMASASVLIGVKKREGTANGIPEIYVNDVILDFAKDGGGIK